MTKEKSAAPTKKNTQERIAIPTAQGQLCLHFGHCEAFAVVDVEDGTPSAPRLVTPPAHAPGVLPAWLAQEGVTTVIAGGMGMRAQSLFREAGIHVVVGAPALPPEALVEAYRAGTLPQGDNPCDH